MGGEGEERVAWRPQSFAVEPGRCSGRCASDAPTGRVARVEAEARGEARGWRDAPPAGRSSRAHSHRCHFFINTFASTVAALLH